jgi:hypothetical protein
MNRNYVISKDYLTNMVCNFTLIINCLLNICYLYYYQNFIYNYNYCYLYCINYIFLIKQYYLY